METKTGPETSSGTEVDPTPVEPETSDGQDQTAVVKPEPWTKRTPVPRRRTRTRRHGITGRKWTWGYVNVFQPVHKWTVRGRLVRPTLRTTIPGCIYYAMKRVKRGTDDRIHRAALDDGLETLTVQPTFSRVQKELRLLQKLGVITRKRVSPRRRHK